MFVMSGNSVNSVSNAYSAVLPLSLMVFFIGPRANHCATTMSECGEMVLGILQFKDKTGTLISIELFWSAFWEKWLNPLLYILYFLHSTRGADVSRAPICCFANSTKENHKLVKISCKAKSLCSILKSFITRRNCWEAARLVDRSRFESWFPSHPHFQWSAIRPHYN